jgi:hypothetical protein
MPDAHRSGPACHRPGSEDSPDPAGPELESHAACGRGAPPGPGPPAMLPAQGWPRDLRIKVTIRATARVPVQAYIT